MNDDTKLGPGGVVDVARRAAYGNEHHTEVWWAELVIDLLTVIDGRTRQQP